MHMVSVYIFRHRNASRDLGFEHLSPFETKERQASTPVHSFQIPAKIVVELGTRSSNVRDYKPDFHSALGGSLAPGEKKQPIALTVKTSCSKGNIFLINSLSVLKTISLEHD